MAIISQLSSEFINLFFSPLAIITRHIVVIFPFPNIVAMHAGK